MAKMIFDIDGQVFGRLTVEKKVRVTTNNVTKTVWLCACECGRNAIAQSTELRDGRMKSCGCLHKERVTKHGASPTGGRCTPEYRTWLSMKQRCNNPKATHYDRYGGRGIAICQRWQESFADFLQDMGLRPTLKHTLERIRNDGNYELTNCRWATRKEQAQNRNGGNVHLLTYQGLTLSISQWAKRLEIKQTTISVRLRRGCSTEEALSVSPLPQRTSHRSN